MPELLRGGKAFGALYCVLAPLASSRDLCGAVVALLARRGQFVGQRVVRGRIAFGRVTGRDKGRVWHVSGARDRSHGRVGLAAR